MPFSVSRNERRALRRREQPRAPTTKQTAVVVDRDQETQLCREVLAPRAVIDGVDAEENGRAGVAARDPQWYEAAA